MSKSTGISTAAAKSAPSPPTGKSTGASASKVGKKEAPPPDSKLDKAAENKTPVDAKKSSPPVDKIEQGKTDPPSTDTSKFSDTSDSFSLSRESTGRMSTEGTTRLVDKLVDAYTGEHSCFSSSSSGNSCRGSYRSESDCSNSPGRTRQQLKNLDEAGAQIHKAQERVEQVLEKAVEAKVYDQAEPPEKDVKRAEQEQESLTKAEGRLHRTKGALHSKQESVRQERANSGLQRSAAEQALLKKFQAASPLLKDHLLTKFRPLIAKDAQIRGDHQQLTEAAERHIESDTQAARLAQEDRTRPGTPGGKAQDLQRRLESKDFQEKLSLSDGAEREKIVALEVEALAGLPPENIADLRSQIRRQFEKNPELEAGEAKTTKVSEHKTSVLSSQSKEDLKRKLEGSQFKEQIRQTELDKRGTLVASELETVKDISGSEKREFETRLNQQLSECQIEATNSTKPTSLGKDEEKEQRIVSTLLKTKESQTGATGQSLDSTTKAVGRIDEESVRRTSATLEHLDLESVHSTLDLSRKFGRGVSEVRSDLEQKVARGGPAQSKARQTLGSLDRIIGRTKLLSQADGWWALEQSLQPEGPHLNRFLGLPDGHYAGEASMRAPTRLTQSPGRRDLKSATAIAKRLAGNGSRVDEQYKYETLSRLRKFGT